MVEPQPQPRAGAAHPLPPAGDHFGEPGVCVWLPARALPGTLVGQPTRRGPLVVHGGGAGADEGQVAAGGLVRPDCDRRWVGPTRARRFRAGWRLAVSRVRIAGAV